MRPIPEADCLLRNLPWFFPPLDKQPIVDGHVGATRSQFEPKNGEVSVSRLHVWNSERLRKMLDEQFKGRQDRDSRDFGFAALSRIVVEAQDGLTVVDTPIKNHPVLPDNDAHADIQTTLTRKKTRNLLFSLAVGYETAPRALGAGLRAWPRWKPFAAVMGGDD